MTDETFAVVANEEEQYSIWPGDREIPAGWTALGVRGDREHCLAQIEEIWTDIRPKSMRRA